MNPLFYYILLVVAWSVLLGFVLMVTAILLINWKIDDRADQLAKRRKAAKKAPSQATHITLVPCNHRKAPTRVQQNNLEFYRAIHALPRKCGDQ